MKDRAALREKRNGRFAKAIEWPNNIYSYRKMETNKQSNNGAMRHFLIGLTLMFAGCAPRYLLYSEEKYPELRIRGTVSRISIEDVREEKNRIHMTFLNPNHPSIFKCPLDSIDSAALVRQVKRNWKNTGKEISLIIRVEEAQVGYQAFFFHSDEFSKSKLSILVHLEQAMVAECTGNAELQRKSQKAGEKTMKAMFEESLELSVYKCLEAVKPELEKLNLENNDPGRI